MYYHTNSPADEFRKAILAAENAMNRMKSRGISNKSTVDIALFISQTKTAFKELPLEIIGMPDHSHCKKCIYWQPVPQSNPHADGYFNVEDNECTVTNELVCPAVNAAGFISDDDVKLQIPAFKIT